jgi:hypothetical protein
MQRPELEYCRQLINKFRFEQPSMCPREKSLYASLCIAYECNFHDTKTPHFIKHLYFDPYILPKVDKLVDEMWLMSTPQKLGLMTFYADKFYDQYKLCDDCGNCFFFSVNSYSYFTNQSFNLHHF